MYNTVLGICPIHNLCCYQILLPATVGVLFVFSADSPEFMTMLEDRDVVPENGQEFRISYSWKEK